jgi:hypothetical protein
MNKKIDPFDIAKWAILGLGGFVAFKALRGLGLIKSAEEQQQQQSITDLETAAGSSPAVNSFNPNYWKDLGKQYPGKSIKIINSEAVNAYITNLKNANRPFLPANKDAIFSVFNRLQTQSQVSYLTDQFAIKEKKDLNNWLNIGAGRAFNDTDKLKLINLIKKLPLGIVDPKTKKVIK